MGTIKTHATRTATATVKKAVPAVLQRDGDSCGWATTLWLLKKFDRLDVTQKQLREELNTDARKGVRGWWNDSVAALAGKAGWDWKLPKGTLPKAIYDTLSKRGITIKNPIRAEKFSEYVDYLNDTFDAGGQAAILLFGLNGFMHWMGIERVSRRSFRFMDPLAGYQPFASQYAYYRKNYHAKYFLVFGFVPKDEDPRSPHATGKGKSKHGDAAEDNAAKPSMLNRIYTSFDQVTDAYNEVRDDLIELGLLWRGSKLDKVECFYETIAPYSAITGRMGYFDFDDHNIHFPSVYLPIGWLIGTVGEKSAPCDVIRHEFGHALADRYPKALKKGGLFREAFGGVYSEKPAPEIDPDNWEFDCVSPYAATETREDFAETFMFFVKYKGKIPAQFKEKPVIVKKWKAVAEIVKRVAAATR
jgi:hypothetical protein